MRGIASVLGGSMSKSALSMLSCTIKSVEYMGKDEQTIRVVMGKKFPHAMEVTEKGDGLKVDY